MPLAVQRCCRPGPSEAAGDGRRRSRSSGPAWCRKKTSKPDGRHTHDTGRLAARQGSVLIIVTLRGPRPLLPTYPPFWCQTRSSLSQGEIRIILLLPTAEDACMCNEDKGREAETNAFSLFIYFYSLRVYLLLLSRVAYSRLASPRPRDAGDPMSLRDTLSLSAMGWAHRTLARPAFDTMHRTAASMRFAVLANARDSCTCGRRDGGTIPMSKILQVLHRLHQRPYLSAASTTAQEVQPRLIHLRPVLLDFRLSHLNSHTFHSSNRSNRSRSLADLCRTLQVSRLLYLRISWHLCWL